MAAHPTLAKTLVLLRGCLGLGGAFILPAAAASAQCAPSSAVAYLEGGNVRARMLNSGGLFWRASSGFVYTVPKDGRANAIFSASLWVGGLVDGQFRTAASTYGPYEFWAGPVQANPDSLACLRYDRIYEIRRTDLQRPWVAGAPPERVRDWPAHLGAPVNDGNGRTGDYEPDEGDTPMVLGDQMLWWVMNDAGGPHVYTGSEPLGVEVRVSAFAFDSPGWAGHTTFYRAELTATREIRDARFSLFVDSDLGNFDDDYMGSDSLLHLAYQYNSDDFDEDEHGYGTPPPAVGVVIVAGPEAGANGLDDDRDGQTDEEGERLGLASSPCLLKTRDPRTAEHVENLMRGRRREGDLQREGGHSGANTGTGKPTRFCYPGEAARAEFWSNNNIDGSGTPVPPNDARFLVNVGPFDLPAGHSEAIDFAIVWARGTDHLDSVTELKRLTRDLHTVAEEVYEPAHVPQPRYVLPQSESPLSLLQNYPNPASDNTVIQLSVPRNGNVRLDIVDVLGRTVAVLLDGPQDPGEKRVSVDTSLLPPGLYRYRYRLDHWIFTRSLVIVR